MIVLMLTLNSLMQCNIERETMFVVFIPTKKNNILLMCMAGGNVVVRPKN